MSRSNVSTPSVLYKYCAFNEWTQDIFERNEVYFQSPDGFNDPFDSKTVMTYEGTEQKRVARVMKAWREDPARTEAEDDLRRKAFDFVTRGRESMGIGSGAQRGDPRM